MRGLMQLDKLVYMANQIGKAFAYQPDAEAEASIADHIKNFWDPRMRATILAHEKTGGDGLAPRVLCAVRLLQAPKAKA